MSEQDRKKAERAARERFSRATTELREGAYRFASKLRGQAGIVIEELIDPEGEAAVMLADVGGDAGALELSLHIDAIVFETWLFGQIGDQEQLDLDVGGHWEFWFNFGAWIGETLRRRHGGHWMIGGEDPHGWRLGFSKILLEIAPFVFAEQMLRMGSGAARRLLLEIDRVHTTHREQRERDGGQDVERFSAQHYLRLHTTPLGQWMAIDFQALNRWWNQTPTRDLIKELKKQVKRLGASSVNMVEQLTEALQKADGGKPVGQQTGDRGLFEAIAQLLSLRRATAPLRIDVIEKYVMPSVHIGLPDKFPPLDQEDLASLAEGVDFYAFFVDVVPHKYQADDEGFLSSIPREDLSSPYRDKTKLELDKGDWLIVNPRHFRDMLLEFDSTRMSEKFDAFVHYVRQNEHAPRRRDDSRILADSVIQAVADLKACVTASSKEGCALVFRLLPPPT